MKLNLDFALYKGTTRLRVWWKEVKKHFETVQNAHNDLEDTHAKDKKALTDADAAEKSAREAADNALDERITTEANARTDADTVLGQRITAEAAARSSADSTLSGRIDDEVAARKDADTALGKRIDNEAAARKELDERFKPVAEMAHTHENKGVLDGIDADRVRKWDDGSEGQITLGEWLEHLAEAERQFNMLWELLGMTVYDGGWLGIEQLDTPLDGGDFDGTEFTPLDCGDFEPYVIPIGSIVDGGTY